MESSKTSSLNRGDDLWVVKRCYLLLRKKWTVEASENGGKKITVGGETAYMCSSRVLNKRGQN